MNCSFVRVAEPERVGAIRLVETGEANLRAVVKQTRFGLVTLREGGQSAKDDEA